MRKKTLIKNTNIRLNLLEPEDKRAWDYLQKMDRKVFRSYSRAVVAALNDYFSRKEKLERDPYLETRQKEDAFLERVVKAVEEGARESMPMVMMGSLLSLLGQSVKLRTEEPQDNLNVEYEKEFTQKTLQETEESVDDALDFIDGFGFVN